MSPFTLESPDSLDEVLELLSRNGDAAKLIAGGTGLINLMKQRLVFPEMLVSLHRVPDLGYVEVGDHELKVGAGTSLATIERHSLVRTHLPMLASALAEVASPRIRANATLGGAVAHGDPHQDTPVALIAYGAEVSARSKQGTRSIPLDTFYTDFYETALDANEVVTEVRVPIPPSNHAACYLKYLPRSAEDYATVAVGGAVTLDAQGQVDSARIALGSVASTPVLAMAANAVLKGQSLQSERVRAKAADAVAEAIDPMSDSRGSAEYKREMAVVFTRRALALLAERLGNS